MKKVYYSQDIPAGTAIVVANDEEEGAQLLLAELKRRGLPEVEFTLHRVPRAEPMAMIIGAEDATT